MSGTTSELLIMKPKWIHVHCKSTRKLYTCTSSVISTVFTTFFCSTFSYSNIFVDAEAGPIATPTVIKFSSKGVFLQTWGAGLFYLPHSLTVDSSGHIWVTDVALHQVRLKWILSCLILSFSACCVCSFCGLGVQICWFRKERASANTWTQTHSKFKDWLLL